MNTLIKKLHLRYGSSTQIYYDIAPTDQLLLSNAPIFQLETDTQFLYPKEIPRVIKWTVTT